MNQSLRLLTLMISLVTICSFNAGAQGPASAKHAELEHQSHLAHLESELQSRELNRVMAELEIAEMEVEIEKIKHLLAAAEKQGDEKEMRLVSLELKQAEIRLKMRHVQVQLADVNIHRAKRQLELIHSKKTKKQPSGPKPTPVHIEADNELDIVIIRGPKTSVQKIQAMLNAAKKSAAKP